MKEIRYADSWWKPTALDSRPTTFTGSGRCGRVAAGCAHPGIEPVAGIGRIEISANVPEPGALWNRVGRGWGGDGVLRLRAAIFVVAETIPRSAHRLASTGAGKTRLDDQ